MMYWMWVRHHLRPSVLFAAGDGEKTVLRAFFMQEVEEEKAQEDKLKRK